MNSPTITMERSAAVAKLESYEQAAKDNPKHYREIDRGVMQGYRVLARGGRLVDVNEALKTGGLNLAGIPKLAIARAHVESTCWEPKRDSRMVYPPNNPKGEWRQHATGGGMFDWSTRDQRLTDDRVRWVLADDSFQRDKVQHVDDRGFAARFRAMAPLIPLPLRPKHALSNYFVLWEANWHKEPPRDPYLLRPLAGSLMEIIAEWDLTDLEVAAVRGAMRT